jgi:cation diffusion facilitator family transporter
MSSTPDNLTRYAWLSIAAAIVTIALKLMAYFITDSVGLLSDALESGVNLLTAIVALIALNWAARPADEEFSYGYSKVEYFSSGFEGGMILAAAVAIAVSAIPRLIRPLPLQQVGIGLGVSIAASLINLGVAQVLLRAGRRNHSITLEADAHHLMTDVFTTAGVLIGVTLVELTDWHRLDALVALAVAGNILFTGWGLLRRSARGLLDASLPAEQLKSIQNILSPYEAQGLRFHALRTRVAGARNFISMHVLTPGEWSIHQGHVFAESIEAQLRRKIPNSVVMLHVEPLDDPASWQDTSLDRLG